LKKLWNYVVLDKNVVQNQSMAFGPIHLYVEVQWHIAFNNYTHGPKGIFFAQPLSNPEKWKVDALNIADRRVAPHVSSQYAPH
jgi:hypothetical protein